MLIYHIFKPFLLTFISYRLFHRGRMRKNMRLFFLAVALFTTATFLIHIAPQINFWDNVKMLIVETVAGGCCGYVCGFVTPIIVDQTNLVFKRSAVLSLIFFWIFIVGRYSSYLMVWSYYDSEYIQEAGFLIFLSSFLLIKNAYLLIKLDKFEGYS